MTEMPLLALPAELRNLIYDEVAQDNLMRFAAMFRMPTLLRVCKQLRDDNVGVFFSETNLTLNAYYHETGCWLAITGKAEKFRIVEMCLFKASRELQQSGQRSATLRARMLQSAWSPAWHLDRGVEQRALVAVATSGLMSRIQQMGHSATTAPLLPLALRRHSSPPSGTRPSTHDARSGDCTWSPWYGKFGLTAEKGSSNFLTPPDSSQPIYFPDTTCLSELDHARSPLSRPTWFPSGVCFD